ncbi:MAG: Polyribonucleotide nucleotidyltransferase [Parcubacteria group bacterium GW2011_GWF2_44_8]|nr:MAG: Polyribonucleotide nucleotidyltransferase [Parcubacteria group bacterium GW2011_GWF2_44_8]
MQRKIYTTEFGGKTLTAEFNDLTAEANGSVMIKYGETVVLVTAVMGKNDNAGLPYFPLSVEFEEKFYAAGEILGSRFMRREGKPSDEAVLSARIVDRTIRPLFPSHLKIDVQVVITVLAIGEDDPDILGVVGASLALGVSDIPWNGPVGVVRLARNKATGEIIQNPTYLDRSVGDLDIEVLACGKDGNINMIETAAYECNETDVTALLQTATSNHAELEKFQKTIIAEIGKPKRVIEAPETPATVTEYFQNNFAEKLRATLFSNRAGKDHIYELKEEFLNATAALEEPKAASALFEEMVDLELHLGAVEKNLRADGRGMDDVRELYAQAGGVSPVLHGSGIFYRGGTRIFSALTLGGPEAAQMIDTMEERDGKKQFMHHYNFPPFSVGETGRVGGFNRRMIGHGALAEKALVPVIPSADKFPYTIRLVSETMSSNGSSSMGSVCASTLALMDGGVPITRPVAGIASGVMMKDGKYALLTDIQGPEDEFGDMDFKVAGTTEGVTAIQMDVKVDGIPVKVLAEALEKARLARLQILTVMTAELATPRASISPRAPQIISLQILPEQIGLVIGGGGKTINGIKADTGVEEIAIEDDGRVYITGKNGTAEAAAERIKALTKRYSVGDRVDAVITKLATFGAFAKLDTYNEGLIHISEIAPFRIEQVEGVLIVGETVPVIVSKIEEGKIGLSIKQADPEFASKRGLEKSE